MHQKDKESYKRILIRRNIKFRHATPKYYDIDTKTKFDKVAMLILKEDFKESDFVLTIKHPGYTEEEIDDLPVSLRQHAREELNKWKQYKEANERPLNCAFKLYKKAIDNNDGEAAWDCICEMTGSQEGYNAVYMIRHLIEVE